MKSNNFTIAIILCLTIGLAPFSPEPHIIGKIQWLLGDPMSMGAMDWFDLFLHGAPWLYLIYLLVRKILYQS